MTVPDTSELRRLAEVATPEPWEARRIEFRDTVGHTVKRGDLVIAFVGYESHEPARVPSDAAFIAACDPPTIIAVCDALDAAQAEVERLTKAVLKWARWTAEDHDDRDLLRTALDDDELIVAAERDQARADLAVANTAVERVRRLYLRWEQEFTGSGPWHDVIQTEIVAALRAAVDGNVNE